MASSSTIITESNNINNINNNHGFDETKYWNREVSHKKEFTQPIIKNAKIICLSDANDVANAQLYNNNNNNNNSLLLGLPQGSKVLAIGTSIQDFDLTILKQEKPNVIFISNPKALDALDQMLIELPSIEWIHVRSAGIDYISSSATLTSLSSSSNGNNIVVTNAKGTFSSTLAEYTMMAIAYFAKDLPRLLKQKNDSTWDKYCVEEIRGKTLGIIGYGDIGRACAKLASAYGMTVIAQRRNPVLSENDPFISQVYGNGQESINTIMSTCDYVLISAPLTNDTKGMINKEAFQHARPNTVLINVGRGPIIDEVEMIKALKEHRIKGAALDVVSVEPLPVENELWKLDNVLLSPHNMDMTETFLQEATEFFLTENLPRFVRGEPLLNPVNVAAGY